MRRATATTTTVALVAEAVVIAFVNLVLGLAVNRQSMSLAGLATGAMSAGAWVAGGLFAVFLLLCAAITARVALTDRAPGRLPRLVLLVCVVGRHLSLSPLQKIVGIWRWRPVFPDPWSRYLA